MQMHVMRVDFVGIVPDIPGRRSAKTRMFNAWGHALQREFVPNASLHIRQKFLANMVYPIVDVDATPIAGI